jgi:hypothetical protein
MPPKSAKYHLNKGDDSDLPISAQGGPITFTPGLPGLISYLGMCHDGAEVTKKTLRQLVTHPVMWQHVLVILQHKVETNSICPVMERLVQIYQTPEGISTDEFVGESLKDGLEKFPNPVRDINERLTVILWHWCRDLGTAGQTEFPARDLDMERELINPEFVALVKDDWKQLKGLPVGLEVEFCREKGEVYGRFAIVCEACIG